MMSGMSRFSTGNGSNSSSAAAHGGEREKEKEKTSSIASIASMATMGKSMTKKLGGLNISNLTSLPNLSGPTVAETEKKSKQIAAEKKNQITQVLSILEDVHLQCPQSHTGIILAYAGSNCSPILNPGIRFTWFRMSGEDRIDQVDESSRAWYAPTVDDIGCVICAQCEDNFEQGCSRYNEVRTK